MSKVNNFQQKRTLIFLLTALILIVSVNFTNKSIIKAQAQTNTVSVIPDTQTLNNVGDIGTILIKVENITDLYGFQLKVDYNSSVVDDFKAYYEDSYFLGSSVFKTFTDGAIISDSNNPGKTKLLAVSKLGIEPGLTGSGTLLRIEFKAKAGGTSPLKLASLTLLDSLGHSISDIAFENGEILVERTFTAGIADKILIIIVFLIVLGTVIYFLLLKKRIKK